MMLVMPTTVRVTKVKSKFPDIATTKRELVSLGGESEQMEFVRHLMFLRTESVPKAFNTTHQAVGFERLDV